MLNRCKLNFPIHESRAIVDLNRLRDPKPLVGFVPVADSTAIPLPPKGGSLTGGML